MTDIQICNLALARLGDARIAALSDATAQAQYCSLFYAQTLEELQTEFDWQFCRKLASLTADATPPAFGYARRFAAPSDFLRLIRLNGIDEDENFSKWEIVDGFIHTDLAAPAQIEYIAHVTDEDKFPAVFVEIFSAKLAANLALPLTGSKELFAQMSEVFSSNVQRPSVKALILATAKDRPSSTLTEDELCRQAILRVGTAEQFGPSSQAMLLAKSLYPQVRETLVALRSRGVKLAVVTNKEGRYTATVLNAHQLMPLLDRVVSGDTLPTKKPDPAGIASCLAAFGVTPARALFVGDSSIDVATARNAGVPVWALPYGYNMGQPIAACSPDRIIADCSALLD